MSRTDYSGPEAPESGAAGAGPATQSIAIPADYAGRRLDQALAELLPEHSRSRLKQWIEAGEVRVDGAPAEPRRKLRGGEHVALTAVPAAPLTNAPEDIPLAILHEDDALLVIDKPAGLVVHPGSGNPAGTLLNALLHHAPALAALPRAGIVHRLDKDTSGLLVVAKTAAAQLALVRALAAHRVLREYLAVAHGALERATTIDAPIGRHPTHRTTMAVVASGKTAVTHVTPVEWFGIATLVRCRLETGRTHQIRVHLAAIGHPLLGDPAYGTRRSSGGVLTFDRQALHATRLSLTHPSTGRTLRVDSPPPADFEALVETLREHGEQHVDD